MKRAYLILAISALGVLPVAQAATILSENFDELTPMLTATSAGDFSAIGGTNVDIVGGALFGGLCVAPESGNCIDLDGSNGNSQGIFRTNAAITLQPGVNYYLSFDLIGSQRGVTDSTTVTFGNYSHTFVLASADDTDGIVSNQLVTVSSPTSVFLTFASNTAGNIGSVLDNVVITSAPSTVPEPATLALMGLGFAGLAFTRRKRAS